MTHSVEPVMRPAEATAAPRLVKAFAWLLLGVTSVILAEVVSFSAPFALVDIWGVFVVLPLYTLHALVLAWIVFRPHKRVTFYALFLAGALFGMYEAYLTKVVWQPTWGEMTWVAGGVYIVQTALLILFWHPFMAFILPLLVVESYATTSREVFDSLPRRLRQVLERRSAAAVTVFAVYCGLYQGINSPSAGVSLLSGLSAAVICGMLAYLWRRVARGRAYALRALLPSKNEGIVLSVLLLLAYIGFGRFGRPEALPRELGPHVTVWGIYLVLGALLALNIKRLPDALPIDAGETATVHHALWKLGALFWIVFPLTSALATFLKPAAGLVVWLSWAIGVGVGLLILVRAAFVRE